MNRCFVWLLIPVLFAGFANAQCLVVTGSSVVPLLVATSTFSIDDESATPDLPLAGPSGPWTFPMGGTSWTHCVVSSNGEVYLTDGSGVVDRALFGVSDLAEMRSVAGGSPRIMAMGGDCQGVIGLLNWDIRVDDSIDNEVTICWTGMRPYDDNTSNWSCSVRLTSQGDITLSYSASTYGALDAGDFAGISIGDQVGSATDPATDLNVTQDSGLLGLLYQNDWAPFDLDDQSILFTPNGIGGYVSVVLCGGPPNPPASATSYGVGCYDITTFASVYQLFADAGSASIALEGSALQFVPDGTGGLVVNQIGPSFRPVVNPIALAQGNDSFAVVTPSQPFQHLGSVPYTDLHVSSNGFVMLGAADPSALAAATTVAGFAAAGPPTFVAFGADLNPAAGGAYSYEEFAGVLYITATSVRHAGSPNAQTFQFQLDLQSGVVTLAYRSMDPFDPGAVLVGYSPGGGVVDMGGIDVATDLPFAVSVDATIPAMSMTASPRPISLPGSGQSMQFDLADVPEAAPGVVSTIGVLVISFAISSGVDLGSVGAAGCSLYVATLDVTTAFSSPGATASVPFALPAGVPPGTVIFAQGAALSMGANDLGIVTSNGIELFVSDN